MKKSFFIVLSVILLVFCFSIPVHADETDTTKYSSGNFYYHAHEGYVSICGYLGNDTEISIPSSIAGKPVSEIESKAFEGCDTIETVTIPETVDTLYDDSFSGMSSLKKVICDTINVNINVVDGIEVEYTSVDQSNNSSETSADDNNTVKETGDKTEDNSNTDSKEDNSKPSDVDDYSYEETDDANNNSGSTSNSDKNSSDNGTSNNGSTGNATNGNGTTNNGTTNTGTNGNGTTVTGNTDNSVTVDSVTTNSDNNENDNQNTVTLEEGTTQVADGTVTLISTLDTGNTTANDTAVTSGNHKIWLIVIPIAIVVIVIAVSIILFKKNN